MHTRYATRPSRTRPIAPPPLRVTHAAPCLRRGASIAVRPTAESASLVGRLRACPGEPRSLEAQLVDHRAGEQDQCEDVEPDEDDQHEQERGADAQRGDVREVEREAVVD